MEGPVDFQWGFFLLFNTPLKQRVSVSPEEAHIRINTIKPPRPVGHPSFYLRRGVFNCSPKGSLPTTLSQSKGRQAVRSAVEDLII